MFRTGCVQNGFSDDPTTRCTDCQQHPSTQPTSYRFNELRSRRSDPANFLLTPHNLPRLKSVTHLGRTHAQTSLAAVSGSWPVAGPNPNLRLRSLDVNCRL